MDTEMLVQFFAAKKIFSKLLWTILGPKRDNLGLEQWFLRSSPSWQQLGCPKIYKVLLLFQQVSYPIGIYSEAYQIFFGLFGCDLGVHQVSGKSWPKYKGN